MSLKKQVTVDDLTALPLLHIFRFLPLVDRVRIESVCTRWNTLVKRYGWTPFRQFSLSSFPFDVVPGAQQLQWLFLRCGRSVHALDTSAHADPDTPLKTFLPMLPNLKHLDLDKKFMTAEILQCVAQNLFNTLTSICLDVSRMSEDAFAALTTVLMRCDKIEVLKLRGRFSCDRQRSIRFPIALKFLEYEEAACHQAFFTQIAERNIQLHELSLPRVTLDEFLSFHFDYVDCSRIGYFSIRLDKYNEKYFAGVLSKLPNLRALELVTRGSAIFLHEAINSIVQCSQLVCLKLNVRDSYDFTETYLNDLANTKLCFLSIHISLTSHTFDLSELLKSIATRGHLKFFDTNTVLSGESVRHALRDCMGLNHLFWDTTGFAFTELLLVRPKVYVGKPLTNLDKEKMLCICADPLPIQHEWIIDISEEDLQQVEEVEDTFT